MPLLLPAKAKPSIQTEIQKQIASLTLKLRRKANFQPWLGGLPLWLLAHRRSHLRDFRMARKVIWHHCHHHYPHYHHHHYIAIRITNIIVRSDKVKIITIIKTSVLIQTPENTHNSFLRSSFLALNAVKTETEKIKMTLKGRCRLASWWWQKEGILLLQRSRFKWKFDSFILDLARVHILAGRNVVEKKCPHLNSSCKRAQPTPPLASH